MRIRTIMMFTVAMLILVACTGDGNLTIRNHTSDDIWFQVDNSDSYHLSTGESWSDRYSLTNDIGNQETKTIQVHYQGYHLFEKYRSVKIEPDRTTTLSLSADGGCIIAENNSAAYSITELYISQSSDTNWGANLLEDNLGYNQSVAWTVIPGLWDVKLVDSDGNSYELYNQNVLLDQSLTVHPGKEVQRARASSQNVRPS